MRTGTVTVAAQTVTVTQKAGQPKPTCTFKLSDSSFTVDAEGASESLTVDTDKECTWTAESRAPWLSILEGASGEGKKKVRFQATPNTASARTGTLIVAGQTVTVTQAAAEASEIRVEGDVTTASGNCPTLEFVVTGRTVRTDHATRFDHGDCKDIKRGADVEVRGVAQAAGWILATRVKVDK